MKSARLFAIGAFIGSLVFVGCIEQEGPLTGEEGVPESALLFKGSATYPGGAPVANRRFDVRIQIEGIGTPTCHYSDASTTTQETQPTWGHATTYSVFDGKGRFQYQTSTGNYDWGIRQDPCPDRTYDGLSYKYKSMHFKPEDINVVRLDAWLSVNEAVCAEYCESHTQEYCETYCSSRPGDTTCRTSCESTQYSVCRDQCYTAKRIVATATAYGVPVETIPEDTSTFVPELDFTFKFTSLEY